MSFLKRFSNPTTRLICLEFLFLTFTALPALADNCDTSQRKPLPGCVRAEYVSGGGIITNHCGHSVTIKVDIVDAFDKRITISSGKTKSFSTNHRYKLNCCPRYNRCD